MHIVYTDIYIWSIHITPKYAYRNKKTWYLLGGGNLPPYLG